MSSTRAMQIARLARPVPSRLCQPPISNFFVSFSFFSFFLPRAAYIPKKNPRYSTDYFGFTDNPPTHAQRTNAPQIHPPQPHSRNRHNPHHHPRSFLQEQGCSPSLCSPRSAAGFIQGTTNKQGLRNAPRSIKPPHSSFFFVFLLTFTERPAAKVTQP